MRTKMLLNLSPFQAYIVKNALRSYNTELLTSSDDWKEFDNIFEQIADLSDTSRADDFYKQPNQSSSYSYNLDKRIYNAGDIKTKKIKHGKDLDIL